MQEPNRITSCLLFVPLFFVLVVLFVFGILRNFLFPNKNILIISDEKTTKMVAIVYKINVEGRNFIAFREEDENLTTMEQKVENEDVFLDTVTSEESEMVIKIIYM